MSSSPPTTGQLSGPVLARLGTLRRTGRRPASGIGSRATRRPTPFTSETPVWLLPWAKPTTANEQAAATAPPSAAPSPAATQVATIDATQNRSEVPLKLIGHDPALPSSRLLP